MFWKINNYVYVIQTLLFSVFFLIYYDYQYLLLWLLFLLLIIIITGAGFFSLKKCMIILKTLRSVS